MAFDIFKAMDKLDIKRVPFQEKGHENSRGYSIARELAVRPSEQYPELVAIHEMAHILLGHTLEKPTSREDMIARLPQLLNKLMEEDIHEVEAHSVAIWACSLAGIDFDFEHETSYVALHLAHMENIDHEAIADKVANVAMQILEAGS